MYIQTQSEINWKCTQTEGDLLIYNLPCRGVVPCNLIQSILLVKGDHC